MTEDDFIQWRDNRTTQEVFAILKEIRESYVHHLVSGATIDSTTQTARTVGCIEAFDYLLNIQFEGPNQSVL